MRDFLMNAILPGGPEKSLEFWKTFDQRAPIHLRLGLKMAEVLFVRILPLRVGRVNLSGLDIGTQEHLLQKANQLPVFQDVLEVAKVVAALRAFDHTELEEHIRGRT